MQPTQTMPWRQRSVEQLKAECDRLSALGRHSAAYSLAWQDTLDQGQAFGLRCMAAYRARVVSCLGDPTQRSSWCGDHDACRGRNYCELRVVSRWRPSIDALIGKDKIMFSFGPLEEDIYPQDPLGVELESQFFSFFLQPRHGGSIREEKRMAVDESSSRAPPKRRRPKRILAA